MMPGSLGEIALNTPLSKFATRTFTLERGLLQWITLAAFHSGLGTRLFYDSPLADPLHWVLYKIRRIRLIGRLLYGSIGPPEAWGRPEGGKAEKPTQ
ncbi:MAG: hypothetical protein ACE5JL_02520, partial [Dehalococcoidia bacterium]